MDWGTRSPGRYNNFPFSDVPRSAMLNNSPQQFVPAHNTSRAFIESEIGPGESLSLPEASKYSRTWLYRITPQSDFENAIRGVFSQIQRRILESNGAGRIRVTYRDRVSLLLPTQRTGARLPRVETENSFNEFYECLMYLLESNDRLDASDLYIIVDVEAARAAGGIHGLETQNPPLCYQESQGIFIIDNPIGRMCGWAALAMHMVITDYNNPTPMIPGLMNVFPKDGSLSWERKTGRYWVKRCLDTPELVLELAKYMMLYFEVDTPEYYLKETSDLIVSKFPTFQVVILDCRGVPIYSAKGSEWNKEYLPKVASKFNIYMTYDRSQSHLHYVYAPILFLNMSRTKLMCKGWRWCHFCYKTFHKNSYGLHQCDVLKCSKCLTFFPTKESMIEHCDPKTLPSISCNIIAYEQSAEVACNVCLTICYNPLCLDIHMKTCAKKGHRKQCVTCRKFVWDIVSHDCSPNKLISCPNCKSKFKRLDALDHRCYIQLLKPPKDYNVYEEGKAFYAFDFESCFIPSERQETCMVNGKLELISLDRHVVNYVVIQQCFTNDVWKFDDISSFCAWLDCTFKEQKAVLIAHNLKGYDGRLLFEHYVKVLKRGPEKVSWNGSKIMSMTVGNVVFRDSLLHIQASLESFPKIFGLDPSKFAKGFFPYKFNRPENQAYTGTIPPKNIFEPEMMSSEKRKSFFEWHDSQRGEYIFRQELEKYCISDVDILAKSLEIYIKEGMELNEGLNPMDFATVASYALKVYQTLHMPKDSLAVLNEEETVFASSGFHGGRTDVRKMAAFYSQDQVDSGIYAKYQDVQSLYPTVQFFDDLPCGIPTIITFIDWKFGGRALGLQPSLEEVNKWFGIVKCDICPSEYLHHPIVLNRDEVSGKLLATLLPQKGIVLTTPELHMALKNGYTLEKVYEYHKYKKSKDLFKSYIRTYLKIKIECGGMPSHIKTPEEWEVFKFYHQNVLGISLERDKVVKNPGKKQIAKMMLNSLWGKFAESQHYSQHFIYSPNDTDTMTSYVEFENKWETGEVQVQLHMAIGKGSFLIVYKNMTEKVYNKNRALRCNLSLASFVTSWGALRLWEELNKLGDRVLYHDTDSIVYEYNASKYNISEGKYLGEWEDETSGNPIVKFIAIGPKTYSYAYLGKEEEASEENKLKMIEGHVEYLETSSTIRPYIYSCKCKGFTLNHYNSLQINFNTLHKLLLGEVAVLNSTALKFKWDRVSCEMTTMLENKALRYVYDKGKVNAQTLIVYPYGSERFL